jgi:hypothetical protein
MFKIFAFKGIFIVSMYILIVYCFLYLFKYQIYPYNNEKTIMKNTKISFDARFKFFFLRISWLFYYITTEKTHLS